MLRSLDIAGIRVRQLGSTHFEHLDIGRYIHLFTFIEVVPPQFELIGVFNVPCHRKNNIPSSSYVKAPRADRSSYPRTSQIS
jgi:hypothetical protein